MSLTGLIEWRAMLDRLRLIFPEGMPGREFLVRDATARTVFVALYVGAIDGLGRWIAPRHVVRMSDAQAGRRDAAERLAYHEAMSASRAPSPPGRWYAENTREPLRDEVIRQGLVPANAMIERTGLPTTSPLGRYALRPEFAALFDPDLSAPRLERAAAVWRSDHLSAAALARTALLRTSASTAAATSSYSCLLARGSCCHPGRASRSRRR
jgi:hypothetical protein